MIENPYADILNEPDNGVFSDSSPIEIALAEEGITGEKADIARSIYHQESSSGKNTKTSNAGAVGGMQIIPATFKANADKGWSIKDPVHNARAAVRYIDKLYKKSGGDAKATAAGYYGGEGAMVLAKKGIARKDKLNPSAPDTLQYANQVVARLPAQAALANASISDNPYADILEMPDSPPVKPDSAPVKQEPSTASKVESTLNEAAFGLPVGTLGRSMLHNISKFGTGAVELGAEIGSGAVEGAVNLFGGEEGRKTVDLANRIYPVRNQVAAENMANEAQYQKEVPDSAASYAGAIAGNILPFMFNPVKSGMDTAFNIPKSKIAGMLSNSPRLGEFLGNVAGGASAGAAITPFMPVNTEGDYMAEKSNQLGSNMLAGGVVSGAFPPLVDAATFALKFPYHLIERFLPGGKDAIAGRALNKAAGELQPSVLNELNKNQNNNLNAGQAAVDAGSAEFSALQNYVKDIKPSSYIKAEDIQKANRLKSLGNTPEEILKIERAKVTDPLRDTAITNANIAGEKIPSYSANIDKKKSSIIDSLQNRWQLLTEAVKQKNISKNFYPVPGMPRISPRYSNNADRVPEYTLGSKDFEIINAQRKAEQGLLQYQLDSLEAHGLKPLTVNNISSKIDSMLNTPAIRASNKAPIIASIKQKILSNADENGVIDANALYTIRKELNETIEALLGGNNVSGSKERAASLAMEIRPEIDKAIDTASGGLWSPYIKQYSDLSKKIDQSRVMQYLANKLDSPLDGGKERAAVFANAVEDSIKTLKSSTGFGGYEKLDDVLTKSQMNSVNDVLSQLNKESRLKYLANAGKKAIKEQLGDTSHEIKPIGLLERSIVIANAVLNRIQGGAGKKSQEELALIMQDPKLTAKLMEAASNKEKNAIRMLQKLQSKSAIGGVLINNSNRQEGK